MLINEFNWLAGWLEGEGSFSLLKQRKGKGRPRPAVYAKVSDEDVVERACKITGTKQKGKPFAHPNGRYKTMYRFHIEGLNAVELMVNLYPLMGKRRQEQIEKVLNDWLIGSLEIRLVSPQIALHNLNETKIMWSKLR